MKTSSFSISTMICPGCGKKMFVPRKRGKKREDGHKKRIWCPYCNKVQNFDEYKEGMYIRNADGEVIA